MSGPKHWGRYAAHAMDQRYRVCLVCGQVWRNDGQKPLLHKGRKAHKGK